MQQHKYLKATALFYALIVAVLMAIISTTIISMAHYHQLMTNYKYLEERLIRNAHSGLQLLIAEKASEVSPYFLDLFGKETDSLNYLKNNGVL